MVRRLKNFLELEYLRVWWPGTDILANSFRRNMQLFILGNNRDKPPQDLLERTRDDLHEIEEQLRAGILP